MSQLSDIEIARNAKLQPIQEIAKEAGIAEKILKYTVDIRRKLIFLL